MANQVEKFGLRPVRKLDGSPFINAQNRYRIASNYGTAIFQGDLVVPVADGTVARHIAANSAAVIGVFNGCFYTDPTTQKPTWKNYYPGSVVTSDIMAFVIDDPDVVCKVDADAAFAVADIFKNFNLTNVSGNTQSGVSEVQLDVSASGLTIIHMVQAIDISQNPDNQDVSAANANILVRINNHFYNGSAGL
jgi:hypothetical protein